MVVEAQMPAAGLSLPWKAVQGLCYLDVPMFSPYSSRQTVCPTSDKCRLIEFHSYRKVSFATKLLLEDLIHRLGIRRDRRDRRSCKIFVSCVNFSKKQRDFLLILQVYTHLNANFIHNC